MNTFHFNGRCFPQKQSVAMGTKIGPSVACIFMGYLEELFSVDYEHSTPMQCKRYIDDIVGADSCPEKELQCFIDHLTNFNSSIKYTYTISNNTVTFLDLHLTIDNNHIKPCAHFKPTDSRDYLLVSSSHPPYCKQSIPFSQLFRIKRCCLTMMMSLRSQIKSRITFLLDNTPSMSMNSQRKCSLNLPRGYSYAIF